MKDYFDMWSLSRSFSFKGDNLVKAIKATFDRRRTLIPKEVPIGLSEQFALDEDKNKQWHAFLSRIGLKEQSIVLPVVIKELREFLLSPLEAAANNKSFNQSWHAGGPWKE